MTSEVLPLGLMAKCRVTKVCPSACGGDSLGERGQSGRDMPNGEEAETDS